MSICFNRLEFKAFRKIEFALTLPYLSVSWYFSCLVFLSDNINAMDYLSERRNKTLFSLMAE